MFAGCVCVVDVRIQLCYGWDVGREWVGCEEGVGGMWGGSGWDVGREWVGCGEGVGGM